VEPRVEMAADAVADRPAQGAGLADAEQPGADIVVTGVPLLGAVETIGAVDAGFVEIAELMGVERRRVDALAALGDRLEQGLSEGALLVLEVVAADQVAVGRGVLGR